MAATAWRLLGLLVASSRLLGSKGNSVLHESRVGLCLVDAWYTKWGGLVGNCRHRLPGAKDAGRLTMLIGYARVDDQDTAAQTARACGKLCERVFTEKVHRAAAGTGPSWPRPSNSSELVMRLWSGSWIAYASLKDLLTIIERIDAVQAGFRSSRRSRRPRHRLAA